jgi:hypothetical protein
MDSVANLAQGMQGFVSKTLNQPNFEFLPGIGNSFHSFFISKKLRINTASSTATHCGATQSGEISPLLQ